MNPSLRILAPSGPPVEYELDMSRVRLGREAGNDIVIALPQVSAAHLVLHREADGGYRLVDLDSTNGTRVNGRSVTEVALRDGDEILIGRVVAATYSHRVTASALTPAGPSAGPPSVPVARPVAVAPLRRPGAGLPPSRPPLKIASPAPSGGRKPEGGG